MLRTAAGFVEAYAAARFVAPRLAPAVRRAADVRRARHGLAVLNVDVVRRGAALVEGPVLLVANHVSWLDVYALNSLMAARFVAKAEVRTWPVVGLIAERSETFFIVRGSFRDAARVKNAIAAALRRSERVVVFPEGTTTDGTRVARFHPALLQAAVDTGTPVQPVAIRYPGERGRPNPDAAFIDDMGFLTSLGRVIGTGALSAELTFGEPILPLGLTRRDLAESAQRFIAERLGVERDASSGRANEQREHGRTCGGRIHRQPDVEPHHDPERDRDQQERDLLGGDVGPQRPGALAVCGDLGESRAGDAE
jgi:1-acyl-sn-glycerol-3-phosphate acyltransferase